MAAPARDLFRRAASGRHSAARIPLSGAIRLSCRTPMARAVRRIRLHKCRATDDRRRRCGRSVCSGPRCATADADSDRSMAQNLVSSRRSRLLRCGSGIFAGFLTQIATTDKCAGCYVSDSIKKKQDASDRNRFGMRRYELHVFDGFTRKLARLRAVIVAELHGRPRLRRDRHQPVIQRLGRNRLDQIFVYAKPHRLDDAPRSPYPLSMMIGTSGTGNTPGERTIRTSSAPLISGISQSRTTTSGPTVRMVPRAVMPSPASKMSLMPQLTKRL